MQRREFIKLAGITAVSSSVTGFSLVKKDGLITTSCATSADVLGPFFRENAPVRNDLRYEGSTSSIPLKVIGKVYGSDCKSTLSNVLIDVWHCDEHEHYDMESKDFKCRARIYSDENGFYWYKTFLPPPYGSRPKHIHYLINKSDTHNELVTQLYFKNDEKINRNLNLRHPWDDRRILDIYQNAEGMNEVKLDLYLTTK